MMRGWMRYADGYEPDEHGRILVTNDEEDEEDGGSGF